MNDITCIGSRCYPRPSDSLMQARERARSVRRELRTKVLYEFCERCDGFHIKADPDFILINSLNRRILELCAIGYRGTEIAMREEIGLTHKAVKKRLESMSRILGANSVTHLVVIAMYLGLIKPQQHLPDIKESHG